MSTIPYVIEKTSYGERSYDIFSKLLKNRIIILTGPINDDLANTIVHTQSKVELKNNLMGKDIFGQRK